MHAPVTRRVDRLTLSEGLQPEARPRRSGTGRPWIAIRWRCCGAYSRVYREPSATCYRGACPRCGHPVTLRVAPGGSDARFFEAG